jgi:creatinine amidohydrolase
LKKFLFLNTHLGNVPLIDQEADLLTRECDAACMQIDWWRYAARIGRKELESGDWAAGHAGELGTSILLYFAPELVDREAGVDFIPPTNPWPAGLTRYESYREVTPSGVLGQASAGSLQKGEIIVHLCVKAIVADCRAFF